MKIESAFKLSSVSESARAAALEPLAIIGMGCRFPGGAADPARFWENLLAAKDCIVEVPPDRWEVNRFFDPEHDKPGKMYVTSGGFLSESIYEFDALFFGVAPREAAAMDPQQRLLMEVSWEALEDAGIDPEALAGSDTGVFVGGFMLDNKLTQLSPLNRHTIAANTAVGMTLTMLSNRLSYLYDLRGPSMTIDTACSSSMVALDQACRSIWNGDSELALVGGVNVMHRPEGFICLCKGGFLAPDGRSKAFDARANGYGRGEGAGIVVVKPLSAAERGGDRIYALIRATGCNQDGRTDGITVPNPESQQRLIRKVARRAGVPLGQIDYFEAHGTGTAVGDPLEMSAIGATIGMEKSAAAPCVVGSVKGSIGHLEAASGVAGLIKTALCLQHRRVPPQANLEQLNPNIPFEQLHLKVPREPIALPQGTQPLYAAINSFGYGGTNAGVLLQSYTPAPRAQENETLEQATGRRWMLPLSARTKPALLALVDRYLQLLENPAVDLDALTYSAGERRAHLSQRLCANAASREELCEQLRRYRQDAPSETIATGQVNRPRTKLAFVFTGMGPQWWAMGRELLASEPVFRAAVQRCDRIFRELTGWSILEEMTRPEDQSRITETQIAQPANFVLQMALVELLDSWGITPAALVGHSVGEVTTAYCSGILSLEQALTVSYHRSRIQKQAAYQGSMLAVGVDLAMAQALIEPFNGKVSVAAINAPTAITLAGDTAALEAIATQLEAQGAFNRMLKVEVAYHSPTMDPLLDQIRTSLAELTPAAPALPTYSSVTGEQVTGTAFDAEYWCRNVREPVYFFKALEQMLADGYEDFLEVGPHPVLSAAIKECFAKRQVKGLLVSCLRRDTPEQLALKQAVAALYVHGYRPRWAALACSQFRWDAAGDKCTPVRPEYMSLPHYPWQREYYWNDAPQSLRDRIGQIIQHVVLGAREDGAAASWLSQINSAYLPYLDDHRVEGLVVLPGAAYIDAALSAYQELTGSDACRLTEIRLHNAMVIEREHERLMQTRMHDGRFEIHSYTLEQQEQYTLHASGNVQALSLVYNQQVELAALKESGMQAQSAAAIYARLASRGLNYGPHFQRISSLWRRDGEMLAAINAPEFAGARHQLHPTLLDACFHGLIAALPETGELSAQIYIPVSIGELRHYGRVGDEFYCHGLIHELNAHQMRGELRICDASGKVLVEILDLHCQALRSTQEGAREQFDQWAYQGRWEPLPALTIPSNAAARQILFVQHDACGKRLQGAFAEESGSAPLTVFADAAYLRLSETEYQLDPTNPEHLRQLWQAQGMGGQGSEIGLVYGLALRQDADDPVNLRATGAALQFLQAVDKARGDSAVRVRLLTRAAQRVLLSDGCNGFAQSPVIGLARVAAAELPELHCTAIDLDASMTPSTMQQLVAECMGASSESELALRDGCRFAYRLTRSPLAIAWRPEPEVLASNHTDNFELAPAPLARLTATAFQASSRRVPSSRELELEVQAAAFDGTAGEVRSVSARVVRTGDEVTDLRAGEEIIACYRGDLGRYVTLERAALLAVHKPAAWQAIAAAGALAGLTVARAALDEYAGLGEGHAVLLLGSDSGLGQCLAALANRQRCTCVRVATRIGSNTLHLHSATLMGELLALRPPHGFDLLITTAGQPTQLDITALLGRRGRYLDLYEGAQPHGEPVKLASGQSQLQLSTDAVLEAALAEPVELEPHLKTLVDSLGDDGVQLPILNPTSLLEQPTSQGVLSLEPEAVQRVIGKPSAAVRIKPDATYLITGGFGGFGLGVARWLVEQGARQLVLVGRSGAADAAAGAAVAELRAAGAQVWPVAADIADAEAVRDLLQRIDQQLPPLAGIFHAAGVLDDRELLAIDTASLERVMRPKALGAWHLHQFTQHLPLDCMVLFSSVSALIGNRRQASYVAANLLLDNLAHFRHARGLTATSINWGAIAGVGMAGAANVIQHLERLGIHGLSLRQALAALAQLLQAPVAQFGIFQFDWQRWAQLEPASASPRFADLIEAGADASCADDWATLHAQSPAELTAAVNRCLANMLATTLKLAADHIDADTPINRYGLDSLMAIDLQMQIREAFKLDISILELMKGNSINQLAELIAARLGELFGAEQDAAGEASEQPAPAEAEPHTDIDELTEQQLDELLRQELALV